MADTAWYKRKKPLRLRGFLLPKPKPMRRLLYSCSIKRTKRKDVTGMEFFLSLFLSTANRLFTHSFEL